MMSRTLWLEYSKLKMIAEPWGKVDVSSKMKAKIWRNWDVKSRGFLEWKHDLQKCNQMILRLAFYNQNSGFQLPKRGSARCFNSSLNSQNIYTFVLRETDMKMGYQLEKIRLNFSSCFRARLQKINSNGRSLFSLCKIKVTFLCMFKYNVVYTPYS